MRDKYRQLNCTRLPHNCSFFCWQIFQPHSILSQQIPSAHLIDLELLPWAAEWEQSGINKASDKSAWETCVSVFNSFCNGVPLFVEPLGFHYTKTNGWSRHSWILERWRAIWGGGGRKGQAISLISSSMSQVAWKLAARRLSERWCTTKRMHISSGESVQ